MLGIRWWRSRPRSSTGELIGSGGLIHLLLRTPRPFPLALALAESRSSRRTRRPIVADVLLHLLNTVGADIVVSLTTISIALYLCTAFSFGRDKTWLLTRFAFVFAAGQTFPGRGVLPESSWQKETREASRSPVKRVVATQLVQAKREPVKPTVVAPDPQRRGRASAPPANVAPIKSGIERTLEEVFEAPAHESEPGIGTRRRHRHQGQDHHAQGRSRIRTSYPVRDRTVRKTPSPSMKRN